MAPIDRAEHRQQRMRGAGVANVQTNFSFNLGGLSRPAKQTSLPPQHRSRTPQSATPTAHASVRKHRSVSAPRSVRKSTKTPQPEVVTPKVGKRKRGSNGAVEIALGDDVDELSPEHVIAKTPILARKIQPARATVSPIREEREGSPDELSVADVASVISSARKAGASPRLVRETPVPAAVTPQPTIKAPSPIAESVKSAKQASPEARRRTTSTEPRSSSKAPSPATKVRATHKPPSVQRQIETQEEDELSTPNVATARARRSKTKSPHPLARDEGEEDELSLSRIDVVAGAVLVKKTKTSPLVKARSVEPAASSPIPRKRGRPKRATVEPSDPASGPVATAETAATAMASVISAPIRQEDPSVQTEADATMLDVEPAVNEPAMQDTKQKALVTRHADEEQADEDAPPINRTESRSGRSKPAVTPKAPESADLDEEEMDELSFEGDETALLRSKAKPRTITQARTSPAEKDSFEEDERDSESDAEPEYQSEPSLAPRPRASPKQKPRPAQQSHQPPRKRQKRGPTQAISVMRLKGFVTKGLSVVDTTRTIMEDWTTHRINRLTDKLSRNADPASSRALRRKRHLILEYREKLDDVLLDLQDANNTASSNAVKLRGLNRQARELRNEYFQVQRDREKIALEQDEIDEEFTREKKEREAKERLSASLFDIQAAIENGKERARKEGRQEEGPELPLKMVMEDVAKGFGAAGGLLGRVRGFNGMLESAAKVLEGRV